MLESLFIVAPIVVGFFWFFFLGGALCLVLVCNAALDVLFSFAITWLRKKEMVVLL